MPVMIFGSATSHCSLAAPLTLTKFSLYVPGKNRTTQKEIPVDTLTFGAGQNQSSVIFHRGLSVCCREDSSRLSSSWLGPLNDQRTNHVLLCEKYTLLRVSSVLADWLSYVIVATKLIKEAQVCYVLCHQTR